MDLSRFLPKTVKTLLLATVLTPLIVVPSVVFPFILGKITLLRGLVLLALAGSLFLIGQKIQEDASFLVSLKIKLKDFFKSAFGIFLSLTTLSFLISAFLATDKFIAFWGDIERGEGIFGIFTIGLFLLLSYFWFKPEDWKKFWWGVWVVGVVVALYGWLEYFGWLGINQLVRPDSLVGNSGIFSTHLIWVSVVPVILWAGVSRRIKYLFLVSEILFLLTVFLASTRGAFLGLVAGVVFLGIWHAFKGEKEIWFGHQSKRFWARMILGLVFLLVLFFGFTRTNPVWTKVPLLNRLAGSSLTDIKDPSTASRLITWKVAWEAFKEKPLLGWGPEHFITAYEKYYDPEFATYGETWMDRAHNQFLDVLVTRGLVGLGLWLVLLVFLFSAPPKDFYGKHIWWAILIAYIVQGLFIFDSFISYLVIASFLAFWQSNKNINREKNEPPAFLEKTKKEILIWGFRLISLAVLIFVYFAVILPFAQAREYREASKNTEVQKVVEEIRIASYPYTFVQPNLRIKTVDTFYLDEFFYRDEYRQNPRFKPLGDILIENMQEVVRRHNKYDVRYTIQLVEVLNAYAREDKNIYTETEKILRQALLISPNRLELFYHLAFSLASQGKTEEAVKVARETLAMNSRAPRSHFSLALMFAANHQDVESQAQLLELEKLDPNYSQLLLSDKKTLGMLYSAWQMYDKVGNLVLKSLQNTNNFGVGVLDRATYENGLRYFAAEEKAEEFLLTAEYLKKFPDLKEDMETLSDLVKNGNWAIIHSLK